MNVTFRRSWPNFHLNTVFTVPLPACNKVFTAGGYCIGMKRHLATLLVLAIPTAAFASEIKIREGLEYLRSSGSDGKAMVEYIKKDPVPISFDKLAGNRLGEYRSRKRYKGSGGVESDKSNIVLDSTMLTASPSEIGEVLFHEYIHRAQDQSGARDDHSRLNHTEHGFEKAMKRVKGRRLRSINRSNRAPKQKLRKISFARSPDSDDGTRSAYTAFGSKRSSRRTVRGRSTRRVTQSRRSATRRVMRSVSGSMRSSVGTRSGAASVSGRRNAASKGRTFRTIH